MSIFGLPLILFQVEGGDDMGDLEYLARIAAGELTSGVLKTFNSIATGPGSAVIATVPEGKDWYLMGWTVIYDNTGTTIILQYPTGTERDRTISGSTTEKIYQGLAKGFKATTTQTITINRSAAVTNSVNLFILEVDTGVSPQLT